MLPALLVLSRVRQCCATLPHPLPACQHLSALHLYPPCGQPTITFTTPPPCCSPFPPFPADDGGEVDTRRLRLYERSKLRYYYAVAVCDSPASANRLYEECDGQEFMKSEWVGAGGRTSACCAAAPSVQQS